MDTTDSAEAAHLAVDSTGVLDEALERLHASGPERLGRLSNHAPMAVEALAARGQARSVHRWLDLYSRKLEEFPPGVEPVTEANWRAALGDSRRAADWVGHFGRELAERDWRDVLARWWPRLLPGMYGGATHPAIRVGHAVRTLLAGEVTGPRLDELAHGLGYWAAVHHPVTGLATLPGPDAGSASGAGGPGAGSAAAALDAVRPIAAGNDGYPARLGRLRALPAWAGADSVTGPDEARRRLTELVRAATHRFATHGHGEPVMLVHAATAPNAVLRTLPALPRSQWVPSLRAAWTASAAVTAMYAQGEGVAYAPPAVLAAGELFERALAHGDEHVVKFADTALDVGDGPALAAAARCIELNEPLTS